MPFLSYSGVPNISFYPFTIQATLDQRLSMDISNLTPSSQEAKFLHIPPRFQRQRLDDKPSCQFHEVPLSVPRRVTKANIGAGSGSGMFVNEPLPARRKRLLRPLASDPVMNSAHHTFDTSRSIPFCQELSSWSLPYAAYAKTFGKTPDQPSPFRPVGATPDYMDIQPCDATTPGGHTFSPSPTTQLVHKKVAWDRSSLLFQGRHKELLESCGRDDRTTLVNYLHDFHVHAFVTAKYWGMGPRQWTPRMISAFTLGSHHDEAEIPEAPPLLCQWPILGNEPSNRGVLDIDEDNGDDFFDVNTPKSWKLWKRSSESSMVATIKESLIQSTFSRTSPPQVPILTEFISRSVAQDPHAIQLEAFKMAILSGNQSLLVELCRQNDGHLPARINEINPLHLAATFLHGGKCFELMLELLIRLQPRDISTGTQDNFQHTVLDTLLITILRSHTSVWPDEVSLAFNPPNRFPGEEKDICGRWDCDSPVLRSLFRRGYARVQDDWKHPFCHTSVTAVCHSIITVTTAPGFTDINTLSGLFVRRCACCGLELKLSPLQAVVVLAFYLAHRGMGGETLFGPLAMVSCLLSSGADSSLETVVSIRDILGTTKPGRCYHELLDAYGLMVQVPQSLVAKWPPECRTGWLCIRRILQIRYMNTSRLSSQRTSPPDIDEEPRSASGHHSGPGLGDDMMQSGLCSSAIVSPQELIWGAIQLELLTYRRANKETLGYLGNSRWEHSSLGWILDRQTFL
uniref:Clr5 domain-containing protein n=1 Tax=Podospora anserina (strain S / ATCC MYA-4624 / DSM 980 / FGSC 10383) TaxID=515849 RepID=A0A090D6J3_PODAN|nr:Putative protein of unknown function [Podospora anserina S mat+]